MDAGNMWSEDDTPFELHGGPAPVSRQQSIPRWDVITRLGIPLGTFLVALYAPGFPAGIRKSAIYFAIVICIVSALPKVTDLFGRVRSMWRDRCGVNEHWPALAHHLDRFVQFVDSGRSDTIHETLRNGPFVPQQAALSGVFQIPPADIFRAYLIQVRAWYSSTRRPTPTTLQAAVNAFSTVIAQFNQNCVLAIFSYHASEMREALTPAAKSALESIRERFVKFLNDYTDYLEAVDRSISDKVVDMRGFPKPPPL